MTWTCISCPQGFITGTLVSTPNGFIPIEQLKPGDTVDSYDTEAGSNVISYVDRCYIAMTDELIKVTVGNEEIYGAFDKNRCNWQVIDVEVSKSDIDELVISEQFFLVQKIEVLKLKKSVVVHGITVSPDHNFFITKQRLLVQNWGLVVPLLLPTPAAPVVVVAAGATVVGYGMYKVIGWLFGGKKNRHQANA